MFIRFLGKNIFYLSNESNLNLAFYEFIPWNDYGSFEYKKSPHPLH